MSISFYPKERSSVLRSKQTIQLTSVRDRGSEVCDKQQKGLY